MSSELEPRKEFIILDLGILIGMIYIRTQLCTRIAPLLWMAFYLWTKEPEVNSLPTQLAKSCMDISTFQLISILVTYFENEILSCYTTVGVRWKVYKVDLPGQFWEYSITCGSSGWSERSGCVLTAERTECREKK